ncbi:MAG: ABC transporter permease [Gammaproteobacteria bacterium]|nr:ABC transporter permease [Gammaproteobacteria bacterium]
MDRAYIHPLKPADIKLEDNHLYIKGDWTKHHINLIQKKSKRIRRISGRELTLDASQLGRLDTAGAITLQKLINRISKKWLTPNMVGFNNEHQALLQLIAGKEESLSHIPKTPPPESVFTSIGRETIKKIVQINAYLAFLGQFAIMFFHSIRHFSELQWRSFLNSINEMGYRALPIIALLSFLIGVVLAYQLGVQLETYGANAYIVNLLGQAVLREFGPLITAIIGAGRTSSAITAQLGTMKINQEIDALKTMGFSPFDILVIPRVVASLVAFPLLILWADIFGVMGGMIMTKAFFGTQYGDFLSRFRDVVDVNTLLVGLSKAPVFALIISMVGCFQGLNVSTTADSVGIQTTKSVVQAIFLIIIADAIFSIVYSKLNI